MIQSVQMIERLKPPLIYGESIISVLDEDNRTRGLNVLFTGKNEPVDELVPQVVYWPRDEKLYQDSDVPVICATDDAAVAVFMAIAPNSPLIGYQGNTEGGTNFYVHNTLETQFIETTGFVAATEKTGYELFDGSIPTGWPGKVIRRLPEWRKTSRTTPLFNVQVNYLDFMQLLSFQPTSKLLPWP